MAGKLLEYELIIYDLADISNNRCVCRDKLGSLLRTAVGNIGLGEFGEAAQKTLLALYGAEHLDLEGAQMLSKSKVILLANERTTAMNTAITTTIWAPTVKPQVMQLSLQLLHPEAAMEDIQWAAKNAFGDIRKGMLNLKFQGCRSDEGRHVYFDVMDALLGNKRIPLGYSERMWISKNHLQLMGPLERHADFCWDLALTDMLDKHPDADITDLTDRLAGTTLYQLRECLDGKKRNFKLEYPEKPLSRADSLSETFKRLTAKNIKAAKKRKADTNEVGSQKPKSLPEANTNEVDSQKPKSLAVENFNQHVATLINQNEWSDEKFAQTTDMAQNLSPEEKSSHKSFGRTIGK